MTDIKHGREVAEEGYVVGMERAAQLLMTKADEEVVGTVQHSALLDHAAAIRAEIKHAR